MNCEHIRMYFEFGKLKCTECGKDCTPIEGHRVIVSFVDYRDKLLKEITKIANQLPDEVLKEVELYAEYLKSKR